MPVKNLASLSSSELKYFLDSFDNILSDCDGVLWTLQTPISGVKESLFRLQKLGKEMRFVTNNNWSWLLFEKFKNLQLNILQDDIVYPTLAIISYLKKVNCNKEIFVLGTSRMKQEFANAGFKVANSGPDRIDETTEEIVKNTEDNGNVGAVVCDYDMNLNYINLIKALVYLQRPEVHFIFGAGDKLAPLTSTLTLMGPHIFQNGLREMTGRVPITFGKPAINFNKYIVEKFNIQDTSRTLFIGDSLENDIAFGNENGYQTLLVLTGVAGLEHIEKCTKKKMIPDFYINSLGDLHEVLNQLDI